MTSKIRMARRRPDLPIETASPHAEFHECGGVPLLDETEPRRMRDESGDGGVVFTPEDPDTASSVLF